MNLFKKVKKTNNLLEELIEINKNKLEFNLSVKPPSSEEILERKRVVSDFINKFLFKKNSNDIYFLSWLVSTGLAIFACVNAYSTSSVNLFSVSGILFLFAISSWSIKKGIMYSKFAEEFLKLEKEEKELQILSVDKSTKMLALCNANELHKNYHKLILEEGRSFLQIEHDIMEESLWKNH